MPSPTSIAVSSTHCTSSGNTAEAERSPSTAAPNANPTRSCFSTGEAGPSKHRKRADSDSAYSTLSEGELLEGRSQRVANVRLPTRARCKDSSPPSSLECSETELGLSSSLEMAAGLLGSRPLGSFGRHAPALRSPNEGASCDPPPPDEATSSTTPPAYGTSHPKAGTKSRPLFKSSNPSPVGPLNSATAAATVVLSLLNHLDLIHLLPGSPVHLLHPADRYLTEYTNAAFTPFLLHNFASPACKVLAIANLFALHTLEQSTRTLGKSTQLAFAAVAWAGTVTLRIILSWVFGRVLGFAHPQWFSTAAVHQTFAGPGPLLLCLFVAQAVTRPVPVPLTVWVALAGKFAVPIADGGSGPWIGLSAVIVGLVLGGAALLQQTVVGVSNSRPTSAPALASLRSAPPSWHNRLHCLILFSLPLLATHSSLQPPTPAHAVDAAFAALHPSHPHLLTVLLMTAPRPSNPNYLFRTVESWLAAFPTPGSATASRVRLIVYTHFGTHDVFDQAREHFTHSPVYGDKAAAYVEWHRDPRGAANKLDQRLHVARGLQYAATRGGESAYVLLTEDDFPLCPDTGVGDTPRWTQAWRDLTQAIVSTNEAMPDFASVPSSRLHSESEASSGHCGTFLATGGSGLAIRGFIAAQLHDLLVEANAPLVSLVPRQTCVSAPLTTLLAVMEQSRARRRRHARRRDPGLPARPDRRLRSLRAPVGWLALPGRLGAEPANSPWGQVRQERAGGHEETAAAPPGVQREHATGQELWGGGVGVRVAPAFRECSRGLSALWAAGADLLRWGSAERGAGCAHFVSARDSRLAWYAPRLPRPSLPTSHSSDGSRASSLYPGSRSITRTIFISITFVASMH